MTRLRRRRRRTFHFFCPYRAPPTSGLHPPFSHRLIADDTLGHYFELDTLPKHKKIVSQFLVGAFNGPQEYKGRNMVDAHIGLVGLQHPRDFLIVAAKLDESLTELGVTGPLHDEVMAVAASLEPQFAKVAKFRAAIEADN